MFAKILQSVNGEDGGGVDEYVDDEHTGGGCSHPEVIPAMVPL
jgi:hypothetical protein